jgi:D-alanine-D-alanine ligase
VKEKKVGVLMGGRSAERVISLQTGEAVLQALRRRGYRPQAIDVGWEIARDLRRRRIEAAFVALHGRGGEDGTIQGLLEAMGIAYTGSGVLASALAMNKKYSKWIFCERRLPTPPFTVLGEGDAASATWPLPRLRPPLVVKPASEGSTLGVSLVRRKRELRPALRSAFRFGPEVLVEEYVPGRELTVGILGNEPLPVIEVVPRGGFYDYRAKYQGGLTEYLVPAPLSLQAVRRVQKLALDAHRALGCRGATRVDLRLSDRGRPCLLEVNTIPGMTMTSLLPKAARETGIEFDDLVERILLMAFEEPGGKAKEDVGNAYQLAGQKK